MESYVATTAEILGVYKPQISAETWKQQWESSADDDETSEHFAGLVLIEAIVADLPEPLDVDSFGNTGRSFVRQSRMRPFVS